MKTAVISKYFWGFNKKAIVNTAKNIDNPFHPEFIKRMITLLSRCDKPKELFSLIPRQRFIEIWPKIRANWSRYSEDSDFMAWWETIYEQLLEEYRKEKKVPKGKLPIPFLSIGRTIKGARLEKGISQKDLGLRTGILQPDISKIENGKKNITIGTLIRLCDVLGVRGIEW